MSDAAAEPSLVSISVRVRRTITEDAYVSVLVRDAVMTVDEDGAPRLDAERIFARALELSARVDVEWKVEGATTELHPTQAPPPADRRPLREIDVLEEEA